MLIACKDNNDILILNLRRKLTLSLQRFLKTASKTRGESNFSYFSFASKTIFIMFSALGTVTNRFSAQLASYDVTR